MKEIHIPETCLVLLVGRNAATKADFAKKHFHEAEVLSLDHFKKQVNGCDKSASEVLEFIVGKRLKLGKLTIVNAPNLHREHRAKFITLAKNHYCLTAALVMDSDVIMDESEKVSHMYKIESGESVNVVLQKLRNDKKADKGPFDIIGDVHGCFEELLELVGKLRYAVKKEGDHFKVSHPEKRKLVFVGDLVDRGNDSKEVLRFVMDVVKDCEGYCVCGNHDYKFAQYLQGKRVSITHGLDSTIKQMENAGEEFRKEVMEFLSSLRSHYVLDEGNLVVAHAGLPEEMHGRAAGAVRSFGLYGETTGEVDEFGCPVRINWAKKYYGKALVVYGHTSVPEAEWINNTVDIDTGCVFGGKLTALQYPEKTTVSVDAKAVYSVSLKPIRKLM